MSQGNLFDNAPPEDLKYREDIDNAAIRNKLYNNAKKVIPGIIEKLTQKFGEDILIQTAIVYADMGPIKDLLGKTSDSMCSLDWNGDWTDGETFIEQCKIIGEYNAFNVGVAGKIVEYFPDDKEFRLARERSVVVYIRPVIEEEYKALLKDRDGCFKEDRTSLVGDNILRVKWD